MPAHNEAIDDAWSVAEGAPYLVDVTYLSPEFGIKLIILPGNPAQNTSPNMPRWAAIFPALSSTKLAGSAYQFCFVLHVMVAHYSNPQGEGV